MCLCVLNGHKTLFSSVHDFTNGNRVIYLYGELFFLGGNELLESVSTVYVLKDHSSWKKNAHGSCGSSESMLGGPAMFPIEYLLDLTIEVLADRTERRKPKVFPEWQ